VTDRVRIEAEFERPQLLGPLFGQYDQNLIALENRLGVYIQARGNRVTIEGEADSAARARDVLTGLYNRLVQGMPVDLGDVEGAVSVASEPSLFGLTQVGGAPGAVIRTRRKTIVARSPTQVRYIEALGSKDVIFALGPAGTGKTYLAVAQAVSQLIAGSVDRLVLSRPAVEAGERLGFLPGDMKDKVDPYLRPLYDALYDMLPAEQVERRLASGEIEIAPLAFMRGRTLAHAFIILRGAEHHTAADEDVPDPLRRGQPHGGVRRPQPGRLARSEQVGAGRRGAEARRHRRHRDAAILGQRGGPPPDCRPHRRGV